MQTDPVKGASPWAVAVVGDEQVLVCPDCQLEPGWDSDLQRCSTCGSTRLRIQVGLVVCRACGANTPA